MKTAISRLVLLSLTLSVCAPLAHARNEDPSDAAAEAQVEAPAKPERAGPARDSATEIVLESAEFRAVLSPHAGAIKSFTLKDPRFTRDDKPMNLVTTDRPEYLPLNFAAGKVLPAKATWKAEQLNDRAARFTFETDDLLFVRKVEVGDTPYQLWSTLRVVNKRQAAQALELAIQGHHYVRRADEEGGFLAGRSPLSAGGMCTVDDTPERFERKDILEDKPSAEGAVSFGAVDTVYFTQAIAAERTHFTRCDLVGEDRGGTKEDPDGSLLTVKLQYPKTELAPGGEAVFRAVVFFGPKLPDALAAAGHGLKRASHMGGMPGIGAIVDGLVSLLSLIHDKVVPNWGVAIILLTFFVKLVLYPLTAKSFESMAAMRRLKPEIDALNEKYKDDREKKGAAMMDLYRKHKINPFGGCLPQLLQLPIWWALYMSLSTNVELFHQPFVGHWQDLTAPDPYYVLPIALGVLMWVQQKITPSTMDPAQAKMMLYMMPAMITSFMLFLPAGLTLYMFTNSVLSIGQQRFIEYRIAHKQPASGADASGPSDSPSDASANAASPRRTGRGRA